MTLDARRPAAIDPGASVELTPERREAARRFLGELRGLYLELGEMHREAVRTWLNQLSQPRFEAAIELRIRTVR